MKRLVAIIQFMTRIPIKVDTGVDDNFNKGLVYFPVVGLILGVIYYFIGLVGREIFPGNLTSILIVISQVVLTGGLHLDGVGDSFDGLYSYREKDKILEIMKDSRLGTNGMIAITIVLIMKVTLTSNIIESNNLWVVVIMPVVARTMQVIACYNTRTPRQKGMGNLFIGKLTSIQLGTAIVNMIIIVLLIVATKSFFSANGIQAYELSWSVIIQISSVVILILSVKMFISSVYRKIDGITGDILGCISELAEIIYMLIITMLIDKV